MRFSHYLKTYPYEEQPGHLLLFSTKQASKVLLQEETCQAIEKDILSSEDEALLTKLGILVNDREQEKQDVLGFIDKINARNSVLNITVVLNLDCNFACVYCFEGDMKGKLYMSNETADRLLDFIKEKFTPDKRSLLIDFYGGEPLMSLELIRSLSRSLKSFIENRGASYDFTLVTNGSLFTRYVAEELVPLGLKSVQITLDGVAEIHNRQRPFKSGAGSFDTIIRNIKANCDLVKINIGGNFQKNTYVRFVSLLDFLEKEGLTPDKIPMIKFAPVTNRPTGISAMDYNMGCISINEPWLVEAEKLLRKEILIRGYNTPKPRPATCVIEMKDAYVVNLDGLIYKCPAFIGHQDYAVGDLQSGVSDYTATYKLGHWKNKDCIECKYLPLCFGGCRYMSFVRDGNIDKLDCKKPYLDNSLERLIKQDLQYRQQSANLPR